MQSRVMVEQVSKRYKQHKVLQNIVFNIPNQGTIIHIKGINGSGKSTLFKLIVGLEQPDSGKIKLASGVFVGALIENPGFLERYSLAYNLKYLASLRHNYDEDLIRQLCETLMLNFDDHTKLKDYSIGMRQKVGIIQAIMEKQNVVLLDEPSRGLDSESLIKFSNLMNKLKQDGVAIVIASHENYPEMEIDRCLELRDGILLEY